MKASSAAKLIITGITDKEDISVTINGEDFTRFTFDSETGAMRMQIALKEELNINEKKNSYSWRHITFKGCTFEYICT